MFSIVLVTYNSAAVIAVALDSISSGHQVIVVDNASTDESRAIASSHGATVIALSENLGFGTACNRGAALATHSKLLFLNPDARLESDTLPGLAAAFDRYTGSSAFNPRLLDADGSQFFRKRTMLLPRPYWRRPALPQADQQVTMLTGAALAVRKDVFMQIGGFDERIFLYFEDDDLSARLVKSGHSLHYIHDAVVHHASGRSSEPSDELVWLRQYHAMAAMRYTMGKHGRRFNRHLRIIQEWWRLRRAPPGSPVATRADARLAALLKTTD